MFALLFTDDKQHLSSPVTHFPNLRRETYYSLGPRSDCYFCNPLRPGVSIRVPFLLPFPAQLQGQERKLVSQASQFGSCAKGASHEKRRGFSSRASSAGTLPKKPTAASKSLGPMLGGTGAALIPNNQSYRTRSSGKFYF